MKQPVSFEMPRPDSFPLDWERRQSYLCGYLHSGIPACCVVFFNDCWLPAMKHLTRSSRDVGLVVAMATAKAYGYVPCPVCIVRNHFVTLRGCDCPR